MNELLIRMEEQIKQLRSAIEKYERNPRYYKPQLNNARENLFAIGTVQRVLIRKLGIQV